jgi:branched-chain amino acid aminotransferase
VTEAHPGFDARGFAYLEGELVPIEEARISIATHAFNYGTGCFEGIRAYWNPEHGELYAVKLVEHFRRLLRSCRTFRIDLGKSAEDLAAIALEVVRRGGFREDTYVRPVAYKASPAIRVGLNDLRDGFCCFTAPMGDYHDIQHGLNVTISAWRRNDDNAIPARAKATGGYLNAALAIADAQDAGYDEAIMLTAEGHVSEASAANLFLVTNGILVTPRETDDILVGITREAVMEIAAKLGVPVQVRQVDRTELYVADEMFLCGTGVQIAPVTRIDGRSIGTGKMGEVTRAVQDLYLSAVHGEVEEYRHWVTPVYGSAPPGA